MVGSWSSASLRSENLAGTVWLSAGAPGVTSRPFTNTRTVRWSVGDGARLGGTGLTGLRCSAPFPARPSAADWPGFLPVGRRQARGSAKLQAWPNRTQGAHGVLLCMSPDRQRPAGPLVAWRRRQKSAVLQAARPAGQAGEHTRPAPPGCAPSPRRARNTPKHSTTSAGNMGLLDNHHTRVRTEERPMLTARFLAMPVIALTVIVALAQAHSRPGTSTDRDPDGLPRGQLRDAAVTTDAPAPSPAMPCQRGPLRPNSKVKARLQERPTPDQDRTPRRSRSSTQTRIASPPTIRSSFP